MAEKPTYEELEKRVHELEKAEFERKRVEKELKEAATKWQSTFEVMSDSVWIIDLNGHILEYNSATLKMFDLSDQEIEKKHCWQLVHGLSEPIENCPVLRMKKSKKPESMTFQEKGRWLEVSVDPIFDDTGQLKGGIHVVSDITDRKQVEEVLRTSHKMESIGTLAGGIAHDFNNILYVITGNAELALEDIPEWNPVHANLKEIKAAGLRAAGIVKQLLNFSRKTDEELKPIGAITVIKDVLKFLQATIPATIKIRKHLPNTDVTIFADSIQVKQVLMNICTNASQAMEETGGILKIYVENETLTEESADKYPDITAGEYLKITVSDTGPGIDSEIIDRIFDPYFTTKEVGKGSGMGLAVVHGIIINHGGAITVDSEPGKGATFTILFPVVVDKPAAVVKTPDEIPIGTETILFVDDEKSIVTIIGQMLERLGYKVETKQNPVETLKLFQSKPDEFDLVITDMTMPQMTGVKLSEKLKDVRSDIPVIICTGHSSLIDEEKAKKLGIAAYVMKPIVMSDIAKTIRKVLDEVKASTQE